MQIEKNIFLALLFFCTGSLSGQTIHYVNQAAIGANTGQNWMDAYTNLHAALNIAQYGDEIWIATGMYLPDANGDRNAHFELSKGIKLIGGFLGDEDSIEDRDWVENPVLLSGNIGNPSDSTDNSNTILYLVAPDSNTIIDGVVFEHGFASSDSVFDNFHPLRSGGAVYIEPSGANALTVFKNCVFRHNYARGYGGVYFCNQASANKYNQPFFYNCKFWNNKSLRDGGAIYLNGGMAKDSGIDFDHCEFISNESGARGGAMVLRWDNSSSSIDFRNSIFDNNKAATWGGVCHQYLPENPRHSLRIDSCTFTNNVALTGPSIFEVSTFEILLDAAYYNFNVQNSIFRSNGTDDFYTPLYGIESPENRNDSTIVINNVFESNNCSTIILVGFTNDSSIVMISNNLFLNNFVNTNTVCEAIYGFFIDVGKVEITNNKIIGGNHRIELSTWNLTDSPITIANNIFSNTYSPYNPLNVIIQSEDNTDAQNTIIANNLFINNTSSDSFYTANYTLRQKVYNNIFLNNRDYFTGAPTIPIKQKGSLLEMSHNYADWDCQNIPGAIECGPGHIFETSSPFLDTTNMSFQLAPCSFAVNGGENGIVDQINLLYDQVGAVRIQDGIVDIGPLESPELALSQAIEVSPACNGPTGSLEVSVLNACLPLSYTWTNGNNSGTELENLAAGLYELTINDSNGKQMIVDVTIPGSFPMADLSADTIVCLDAFTDIQSSISGTIGQVTYAWNEGSATESLFGVGPGHYVLTVTDSLGCSASDSILIQQALPLMSETITVPASGPTEPDGSILVEVQMGTAPYDYTWSTSDTTALVTGLPPGDYDLTITDGAGCMYVYLIQLGYVSSSDDFFSQTDMRVVPNPAHEFIYFDPGPYSELVVYDSKGRLVFNRVMSGQKSERIDFLAGGTYFYVFKGERLPSRTGVFVVVN
ncbi:MAG: hypothetical protein R2792_18825 [Saprospiraceae bacterium]